MTISLRAAGTAATNTTSPNPSYPAGVQANDMNVLVIAAKSTALKGPDDMDITTPAGWKLIHDGRNSNNPTFSPPTNSGSVRIAVYIRTGSAFSGAIGAITITNCSVAAAVINTYAGSAGTGWNTATTFGYDISLTDYDSNRAVVSTNQFFTTNDWLLSLTSLGDSIGLGTTALTATSATLGTVNVRQAAGSSIASPSAQLGLDFRDAAVTAGTSTAGPRLTGTANQNGISVFVRLREGTAALAGAETGTGTEKSSLGATDDLPVTRTWANGDDLSAALFNANFSDPIAWHLTNSPGIQAECTTTPNLTSTTHTVVWDKYVYRRGGMVINGTKISVPTTGFYIGQFGVGVEDIGTMNLGWLLTVDVLVYPGGTGSPTVQNVSTNFTDMSTEQSFTVGGIPFSVFLNAGDAIELRMSGGWGTAGTRLWANQPGFGPATDAGKKVLIDLHWDGYWGGGTI